ncbi:MAG TPA: ATP-binding protein [Streptosporangiaceae bacterium]|nr:ATP-binding protein [Streptosporangiaceae bacterium]
MIGARLDLKPIALADTVTTAEERILARRTFQGLPGQVSVARRWLAQMIDGFAAIDDVLLACSELATNAIMHSDSGQPGGMFTVRLAIRQDVVRVEVLDQGGAWPGRRQAAGYGDELTEDASQCGRGLTIVAAITDAWGIVGDREGRTTWCEIRSE